MPSDFALRDKPGSGTPLVDLQCDPSATLSRLIGSVPNAASDT
jgi:hypothetical protein